MPRITSAAEPAPHSWDIEHWPASVYPHTPNRGRYVVRMHRNDLMLAGALTRIGREIVVIGHAYTKWLAKKSANVTDFEIAPNRAVTTAGIK